MKRLAVLMVTTIMILVKTKCDLADVELWNNYIGWNSSEPHQNIFSLQDIVTRKSRDTQQVKSLNISALYASSLNYTDKILRYMEPDPLEMTIEQLRPHVRALLQELDFLKVVEDFVGLHLGVTTPCEAHALYNLLDLYSALEERRQGHLQKVMERLLMEASPFKDVTARLLNPTSFVVKGFATHIKRFRDRMTRMYRSVLVVGTTNLYLAASYRPKSLPKMEFMMSNLSIETPFLAINEKSWYHLRLADHPEYKITAVQENQRWLAVVENSSSCSPEGDNWNAETTQMKNVSITDNNITVDSSAMVRNNDATFPAISPTSRLPAKNTTEESGCDLGAHGRSNLFSFKIISSNNREEEFSMSVFKGPDEQYLSVSNLRGSQGRKHHPHFGSNLKKSAKLRLVRLPGSEVALVQRMKIGLRFLYWSPGDQHYLRASCHYPGRAAHWVLQEIDGNFLT